MPAKKLSGDKLVNRIPSPDNWISSAIKIWIDNKNKHIFLGLFHLSLPGRGDAIFFFFSVGCGDEAIFFYVGWVFFLLVKIYIIIILIYLCSYSRILVMISHSQDFLNGVCTNIIHMQNQKLRYYGVSINWWKYT